MSQVEVEEVEEVFDDIHGGLGWGESSALLVSSGGVVEVDELVHVIACPDP